MKLKGFRPSTKALYAALALALLSLAHDVLLPESARLTTGLRFMWITGSLFLLALIYDFWLSRRPPNINITRNIPNNVSVNVAIEISLNVVNSDPSQQDQTAVESDNVENVENKAAGYEIAFADLQPESWEHNSLPRPVILKPGSSSHVTYETTPRKRGSFLLHGTQCRVTSHFGLWQLDWIYDLPSEVRVYPDFRMLHDLSGLNGSATLRQEGLRKYHRRGAGMDFKQLRDYRDGESLRQVDWRATSRFNKLIAREFQDEKNQSVVIMLDAGQRMMVQDAQLNYFDYALNTLIALSHTVLKNGDELSLLSFGQSTRWLGKVKGVNNTSQVLNHFFDLHPQSIASDYLLAATRLMEKCPKRSLVILVSCLRDEDFEDLLLAVKLLQKNHLVAVASIEDGLFEQVNQHSVESMEDAGAWLATQDFVDRIEKNRKKLEARGVICISSPAANITPSAINTYLKVKRSGAL